jgi:hypothetical protein
VSRRTVTLKIPGVRSEARGARDNGKTFLIHEMPADQGERWCMTALGLIFDALGKTITPEQLNVAGAAGLASAGADIAMMPVARALMDPSLDEMWRFVEYQHAPNLPPRAIQTGENSDIEEISTRTRIRLEVLNLHTGFFGGGEPQNSPVEAPTSS